MIQIKLDDQSPWKQCQVFHLAFGTNNYIRCLPQGGQPVTLYGNYKDIRTLLETLLNQVGPELRQNKYVIDNTVTTITPQEVIDYFRNSPVLSYLADDVAAALLPGLGSLEAQTDLELVVSKLNLTELFDEHGKPAWGMQTKIADALGVRNAGANRAKILKVAAQLAKIYSTSTPKAA